MTAKANSAPKPRRSPSVGLAGQPRRCQVSQALPATILRSHANVSPLARPGRSTPVSVGEKTLRIRLRLKNPLSDWFSGNAANAPPMPYIAVYAKYDATLSNPTRAKELMIVTPATAAAQAAARHLRRQMSNPMSAAGKNLSPAARPNATPAPRSWPRLKA